MFPVEIIYNNCVQRLYLGADIHTNHPPNKANQGQRA